MLSVLYAALFGILEGVTEWLPISSTGHLILLDHFLPFPARPAFFELFEVAIQLAAIGAVISLYFEKLNPLRRSVAARRVPAMGASVACHAPLGRDRTFA